MIQPISLEVTLDAMGYLDGWAGDDVYGITLWIREEPQPTEDELIAAGWIKIDPPA